MQMTTKLRRAVRRAALTTASALALVGVAACDDAPAAPQPPQGTATFIVDVVGSRFTLRASDPQAIAALRQRMTSKTKGVVHGRLVRGNGGFNAPWSWHVDPATVEVPDMSMELCDGQPGLVEEDVAEWVDNVKYYCPWGAEIVAEVR